MNEYNNIDIKLIAGQKMMVGFDGREFNSDLEFLMSELKIGGFVLFAKNIKSPEQLKTLIKNILNFAKSNNLIKPFIAIDQEGGEVARLKKPFKVFQGNPSIKNITAVQKFAKDQASQLADLKINMNFAPVIDVIPDNFTSIMEKRAFKGNASKVGALGYEFIKTMQESNIMAVAKHFPGIGRTQVDSHFNLPVVQRNINDLFSEELIPFRQAIKANVAGIMLSHILYPALDSKWQASLSPEIVKKILREKMSYKGLIITDDLDMKAVQHDIKISARQILLSDVDIGLICHKGVDIELMFNEFISLIKKHNKLLETARISLNRIINMKNNFIS